MKMTSILRNKCRQNSVPAVVSGNYVFTSFPSKRFKS